MAMDTTTTVTINTKTTISGNQQRQICFVHGVGMKKKPPLPPTVSAYIMHVVCAPPPPHNACPNAAMVEVLCMERQGDKDEQKIVI